MPNTILQTNARTLPEPTQYRDPANFRELPQPTPAAGNETLRSSRRGVLGTIGALFAVSAGGVAASAADSALPIRPAPSAVQTPEALETPDALLLILGLRADQLKVERQTAYEGETEARERFYERLPKTPMEILILSPIHPGADHYGASMGCVTAWHLRRDLPGVEPRSRLGRWMKKALKIAEHWEECVRQAKRASGLEEAQLRVIGLDQEIESLVQNIFAFTPSTPAGCAAQARGFHLAHEWARDRNAIASHYGPLLAEAVAARATGKS
jgi:hypothetical protein